MAKILFIEPMLRTDKLGILYLAAVLRRAGHAVDLAMVADAEERKANPRSRSAKFRVAVRTEKAMGAV